MAEPQAARPALKSRASIKRDSFTDIAAAALTIPQAMWRRGHKPFSRHSTKLR
jgi:hypothetical protein